MKVVLASGNKGKLAELGALLADAGLDLVPQAALGIADPVEDGHTFVENALIKARNAARLSGLPALADDWQRDPPMAVAGSAIGAFPDALPWPPRQWPHERHRARALAALARSAWRRGEGRPPEAAVPVYLRDKVAQTTAEREAARAVAAARVGPA